MQLVNNSVASWLTVWTIHVIRPAVLALVPFATAVWIGPVPPRLRTHELFIIIAVLVIGVANGPVAAVHTEAVVTEDQSLIETHLVARDWI